MIPKRKRDLKSRGASNGIFQRVPTDKVDCTYTTPDFCALKDVVVVVVKESRGSATVDLPAFFLQTEANKEVKLLMIKFTGAVALLLVECDELK